MIIDGVRNGKLVAADRADCCGVQAMVRVHREPGMVLDFCGHHYTRNEIDLALAQFGIQVDMRPSLREDRAKGDSH